MRREFRRTTIITAGCLSVVLGIAASRLFVPSPQLYFLLVICLALILLRRRRLSLLLGVCILAFGIGLYKGHQSAQQLDYLKSFTKQEVTIEGRAKTDSIYSDKGQIEFELEKITLLSPEAGALPGVFRVSGYGEPMIYRGDQVEVTGDLYPTRGSKQARIAYAELARVGESDSWDETLRHNFVAGMYNALPEPQASFGLGLLIGQRSTLPEATLLALSAVGLTHIIAVSGYNLTIMVRAVNRAGIFGSKFQQLVAALALIATFILITGFSASIVRAGFIAVLGLWAWYFGRQLRPILAITFTAALTGLINPFYVWSDIGWYLSFLAFFGVLIVAPALIKRIYKTKTPRWYMLVLFETLCAYVMTLPLIMYIFGQASAVALIANLIVVPLVPFAMLFSAIAGLAGMFIPVMSAYFALPAKVLLSFMLDVASFLASLPFAQILAKLSTAQMLILYGIILLFATLLVHKNTRIKRV